jgi:hypothetical protein
MQTYANNVQDINGNAIAGAFVLVKKNGSAAPIYSDNGITALPNPFQTGNDGVFRFYAASGTYDIEVTSPLLPAPIEYPGVILFDPEDVNGSIRDELAEPGGASMVGSNDGAGGTLWTTVAGFIARVASSAGSSVVGFLQAGTAAVIQSVQSKLRERVSVKDFGAVGDGVADDYAAIVKARDYCLSVTPYKKLVFPAGRYKTTQRISFDYPGLFVEGDGMRSSEIFFTGSGVAVEFTDANPNNGAFAFGGHIKDLSICGNPNASDLLRIKNVNHFSAKNINLREASNTVGVGLHVLGTVAGSFKNIVCSTNAQLMASRPQNGIIFDRDPTTLTRATANIVDNMIIEGMLGDGVQLINSDQTVFISGTSENNDGNGVTIVAGSRMNTFISVAFENASGTTFADVADSGFSNKFINCYTRKLFYVGPSAQFTHVTGGFHQSFDIDGDFATLEDLKYSFFAAGGTLATSPNTTTKNLFKVDTGGITFAVKTPQIVTLTGSPFTYTNSSGMDEEVIVSGGTVSQIVFDRGGPVSTLPTSGMFRLAPTDKLVISYSVAPNVVAIKYGASSV